MHSTVVVFPAPLAPISPTISPAGTSRSSTSTTALSPYALRRPRTVTTCGLLMPTIVPMTARPVHQPSARTPPLPLGREALSGLAEEAGLQRGLHDCRARRALDPVRAGGRAVGDELGQRVVGEVRRRPVVAGDPAGQRAVRDQPVVQRPAAG